MKKTKIFAVLGICLAMGLTACGGNTNSDSPKSSAAPASTSSKCTHSWGDWVPGTPATCTADGTRSRTCSKCGEVQNGTVTKLGHDFSVFVSDTSTCEADGKVTYKCSRCDVTDVKDVKAHHKFGAETKVDKTGTDDVDYYTASCSVDNAFEIRFPTEVGGVYSGTERKSGTPTGYTKLKGNGSISWKINLGGTKSYLGIIYHKACMDGWGSNDNKTYSWYNNSNSDTRAEGNFNFFVNGAKVDKSAYMNISFEDLTKGGEDSGLGDDYSPVALCPIGQAFLEPGAITFKYERTGSYNMVMSDIVFIGKEFVHEHNNQSATWDGQDADQHWHVCTAANCPTNGKVDAEPHAFVEVKPEEDTVTDPAHKAKAATCNEEGIKVEVCSKCDYRKETALAKLPHEFEDEAAASNAASATSIATTVHNCANCEEAALRWSALDYDATKTAARSDEEKGPKKVDEDKAVDFDDSTAQGCGDNHEDKGTHIVYNVNIPEKVTAAKLYMQIKANNRWITEPFDRQSYDNNKGEEQIDGVWKQPDSRYGLKVDGTLYLIGKNNGAQKMSQDNINWVEFPGISLTLEAGDHEFEFFKYGGYAVNHYAFQISGLSHVTPTHKHNGDATWEKDATYHWHVCTDTEDCPLTDGIYGKAEHDFGDLQVVNAATCDTDGTGKYVCKDCGFEKAAVIKAAHTWGEAQPVTGAEGKADYNKFVCSKCGAIKLEIELKDSMITGTNKNDPAGYIKLKSANDYFSFAFDYPFTGDNNLAAGKIYQRGVMDGWSSNKGKKLFSGGDNGADDFELLLNGDKVDVSAYKSKTFEQVMTGEPQDGNLSALTDVESGEILLNNGANTVKYTRLASYNLALTHIVFVIKEAKHTHHAGSAFVSDANQHWHVCDADGCPTPDAKMGAEDHNYGPVVAKPGQEPTCTADGVGVKTCSVCLHEEEVVMKATGHTIVQGASVKNSDDKDVYSITCSKGDVEGYQMALADCSTGADKIEGDGKLGKGAVMTWKFKLTADGEGHYKTGKIAFVMCARLNGGKPYGSNSLADNAFADDYSLKVGEKAGVVTCAGKQLGKDFGATGDDAVYFEFGTIEFTEEDLVNGELVITVTQAASQSYRHRYQDNVRIIYVA